MNVDDQDYRFSPARRIVMGHQIINCGGILWTILCLKQKISLRKDDILKQLRIKDISNRKSTINKEYPKTFES